MSAADLAIPGYRIDRTLGTGGFGHVLAAWRDLDGRKVAIKVPRIDRPTAVLRFPREVHALSSIGPPHVPELIETGRLADGRPYLVMEFLDHPTLADLLAQRAAHTRVIDVGREAMAVLDALAAAHARGFVHRDLTPENIFLDERPRARLVDFGLVKRDASGTDTPNLLLTTENTIVGTPDYMSPEQCLGTGLDARSDIYSMGVILFEMLAGVPPFWGQPAVVQQKHVSARPPDLPPRIALGCGGLVEVVHRCLAKNPDRRYQSVPELAAALGAALRECPPNLELPDAAVTASGTVRRATAETRAAPARERRRIGLVFLRTGTDVVELKQLFAGLAGQIVHASPHGVVAGFGHDLSESPAQRALRAAQTAVDRGVAAQATVDLCPVTVRQRLDGTLRFLTQVSPDDERFPSESDPPGLLVTAAAAELLPDLRGTRVDHRPGMLAVRRVAPTGRHVQRATAPLVGREEVVRALLASAREALVGSRPGVAVVVGESGLGKSHLAAELLQRLAGQLPDVEILDVRAREPIDGDADRTLRGLLRRSLALDPASRHPRERVRALLGPELAELAWAPLGLVMGWIGPDAGELRRVGAAPGALRATVVRAAGEILRRRAEKRPLVLLLDDAHFADDTTLGALEVATLAESGLPIWVCALARPAFRSARPSFGDRAARLLELELDPLAQAAGGELCRRLLLPADGIPAEAIDRLVARSQGNPLFLVELVRGLKREGVVRADGRGGWYLATDELDRMPDLPLVEWLAQRELGALPIALAAHARLASLISPELTADEVEGVLARLPRDEVMRSYPLDAGVGLERLAMTGLMLMHARDQFSFRHALVREAVALTVSPEERVRIHAAAFAHYRDAADIPDERRRPLVAEHAGKAGLHAEAAEAYLELAARSSRRHAYLDAETLFSRALDQIDPADRARRRDALRGRGQMRYRLGRYPDAIADFESALEIAAELGDPVIEAELLLDEATALDWASDFPGSRVRVERAVARAGDSYPVALEAQLLLARGRSLNRESRDQEASELLERAAALSGTLGDEGYETHVVSLLMLGFILIGLGRLDDAARALELGMAACEVRGDRMHLLTALNNRGLLAACREDVDQMTASFERVRALAHELGVTHLELYAEYNLAESLYLIGEQVGRAALHIQRAQAIVERRLAGAFRPVIPLLEARIFAHGGNLAASAARIEVIRDSQAAARAQGQLDLLFVPSEEALFAMVELAVAGGGPEAWDALEARAAEVSVGQERIEVVELRGLTALRAGRREEAEQALDRAAALAASIPNAMRRRLARDRALLATA